MGCKPTAKRRAQGRSQGNVCSNRSDFAPAKEHCSQILVCKAYPLKFKYPVANCTDFCHDLHIQEVADKDEELIAQTQPERTRLNTQGPEF